MSRLDDFVVWWVKKQDAAGGSGKMPMKNLERVKNWLDDFWLLIRNDTKSVLDVGCASGEALELFRALGLAGPDCFGLTNQKGEAEKVRNRGFGCFLEDMHFNTVPDGIFDLVFSSRTAEHSPVPFYLLSEFQRIARKHILLIVPYFPNLAGHSTHCSVMPREVWLEWGKRLGLHMIRAMDDGAILWRCNE